MSQFPPASREIKFAGSCGQKNWPFLSELFTKTFSEKTRSEWEAGFDGSDGCATHVMSYAESREEGF